MKDVWNILPVDDIRPHREDEKCQCNPEVEDLGGSIMIYHNAFDGRDIVEERKDRLDD